MSEAWMARRGQQQKLLREVSRLILSRDKQLEDPSFLFWFCRRILYDLEACHKNPMCYGAGFGDPEGRNCGTTSESKASMERERFYSEIDILLCNCSWSPSEWRVLRGDLLTKLTRSVLGRFAAELEAVERENPQ